MDLKSNLYDAWDLLSTVEAKQALGFRFVPYYRSAEVDLVLKSIINPVKTQLRYYKELSLTGIDTGCSRILSGPVGVGKTTVAVSLHALFMLFVDSVVSVYHEFTPDKLVLPEVLIAAAYNRNNVSPIQDSELLPLLAGLSDMTKVVVFFGDEIQRLYIHGENSMACAVVDQLAVLGKCAGHMGVCTGSARDTLSLAHHPSDHGFQNYTTLNHSVYIDMRMQPIRNKDEFEKLLLKLGVEADSELCKWFYMLSGGVGRYVFNAIASTLDSVQDFKASCERLRIPTDLLLNKICEEMLLKVVDSLRDGSFDPWSHSHAIEIARVDQLQVIYGPDINVEKYVEESLLTPVGRNYELLRPGLLWALYNKYGGGAGDRFEVMAFEGTLTGWSGTSDQKWPSAGHKNEPPIMRMIRKLDEYAFPNLTLPNTQGELSPDQYCDTWYTCGASFIGIESFLLQKVNDYHSLVVIQIKTGYMLNTVKLGSIKQVDTAMNIVYKAKQGIAKLKALFIQPDLIKLSKLIFVCTKQLSEQAIAYLESDGTGMEIEIYDLDYVLDHADISDGVRDRLKMWRDSCCLHI